MYVCMYVRTYVRMYVCIYIYGYILFMVFISIYTRIIIGIILPYSLLTTSEYENQMASWKSCCLRASRLLFPCEMQAPHPWNLKSQNRHQH